MDSSAEVEGFSTSVSDDELFLVAVCSEDLEQSLFRNAVELLDENDTVFLDWVEELVLVSKVHTDIPSHGEDLSLSWVIEDHLVLVGTEGDVWVLEWKHVSQSEHWVSVHEGEGQLGDDRSGSGFGHLHTDEA